jgi:hypothetical protein
MDAGTFEKEPPGKLITTDTEEDVEDELAQNKNP